MDKLFRHPWLYVNQSDLETEWIQCYEEGKDIVQLTDEYIALKSLDAEDSANWPRFFAFLDKTAAAPQRKDYLYIEPSDLQSIKSHRPNQISLPILALSRDALYDKVYGAWLGRTCGCLLGKPVEGWRRPKMWGYLKDSGRWPLSDYFSLNVSDEIKAKYALDQNAAFIENICEAPEDDDTNYTVTGLAIMKKHGASFSPADVAEFWMQNIPILHTCTAERAAYRNFVLQIQPPLSATRRNPYREWIGAQIRADFFGYAAPGDPATAADFAWRDASISHVKNGIYGEMWVAAMIAAAFVSENSEQIIQAGLSQIPEKSRLYESINTVLDWHREGISYDDAVDRLHHLWDENSGHGWCHTISNAMVVAIALLWGEGDFGLSICRAVQACFDTDCNGATVGSIVGALRGASNLPLKWTAPINDTLNTGVAGYHKVRISDLAKETLEIVELIQTG